MTKRFLSSIIVLLFVLCLILSGCGKSSKSKKKEKEKENGAIDITIQDEECYAIITKGSGNAYNDHIIEGFKTIIDDAGKQTFVYQPEKGTAKEQIQVVKELIENKVSCIAIAPVDADALDSVLQDAIDADIPVGGVFLRELPNGALCVAAVGAGGEIEKFDFLHGLQ